MKFVKGPDFPTGGIVFRYNDKVEGGDAIRTAYATGRSKIIVQAKAHIEEGQRGRTHIIVTELPYAVNKIGADRAHRRAGGRRQDHRHHRHP